MAQIYRLSKSDNTGRDIYSSLEELYLYLRTNNELYKINYCDNITNIDGIEKYSGRHFNWKNDLIRNHYPVDDNNLFREEFLGVISRKVLAYLAIDILDYTLQEFQEKDLPEARSCLELCRKWFDDPSALPTETLFDLFDNTESCAYSKYFELCKTSFFITRCAYKAIGVLCYVNFGGFFSDVCVNSSDAIGDSKQYLRQGQLIINLFTSGKHLFMV